MKTIKQSIILAVGLILLGCNSEKTNLSKDLPTVKTEVKVAQQYVDDNTFIDVDVNGLAQDFASTQSGNKVDVDKVAKMKAALYRFYSHVNLVDGIYKCDLSSAAEINVSSDVFKVLMKNLEDMNEAIANAKKEGKEIHVSKIDQNYLDHLLE